MRQSLERPLSWMKEHRSFPVVFAFLAGIVLIIEIASFAADALVLHFARQKLNSFSPDFSGEIGSVRTHPFALSLDVKDIVIRQKAHPDRPVAMLPRVHGALHWLRLFSGKLVADAEFQGPQLYINLENLEPELDKMKQAPHGAVPWQEKLRLFPAATLRGITVVNGEISSAGLMPGAEPVRISSIDIEIRNVTDRPAPGHPATIRMSALLPGSGRVTLSAQADLTAKPGPSVKAGFSLEGLDLTAFRSAGKLFSMDIRKGTLTIDGTAEYSPDRKVADVKSLVLQDPEIDYVYIAQPLKEKPPPKAKSPVSVRADSIRITKGTFGVVNKSENPSYRLYLSDADMELKNFSTGFGDRPAGLRLTGRFMNSGDTSATGTFRSERKGPDFSVSVAIRNTDMRTLNNLFRAYGNFDVSKGLFSFYTQLTVKNNRVEGYVKPLFREMKVSDRRTDKQKSEFHKLYEKLVGGVAHLLENKPRHAVATEAPVSGTLSNPQVSTWDTLLNLIQNAFFKAILPGFEENIK